MKSEASLISIFILSSVRAQTAPFVILGFVNSELCSCKNWREC